MAGALLFSAGCQQEDINLASRVSLSQEGTVNIVSKDASDLVFEVRSDGDWLVVTPSWIIPTPAYGRGNAVVRLSFKDNFSEVKDASTGKTVLEENGVRHGLVSVECASGATTFTVCQAGDPDKPSDEIIDLPTGSFNALPDGDQLYRVTGTVTRIANSQYGNLYLDDGSGEMYIYGVLDREGAKKNFMSLGVGVGDILTVVGSKTTYGSTAEMADAQYISHVSALISLDKTAFTVAKEGADLEIGISVKGDGVKVVSDQPWVAYQGITTTREGSTAYLKVEANDGPAREANVTFTSASADLGKESSAVVTIKQAAGSSDVPASGFNYKKATSVTSGKSYIIVVDGKPTKPIAADKAYGYLYLDEDVTVTASGDVLNLSSEDNEILFTAIDGGFSMQQKDGRYMYMDAVDSHVSFQIGDDAAAGDRKAWTVEPQNDGTFKITHVIRNCWMQYSASYSSFGSYPDSRGVLPVLYERQEGGGGGDTPQPPSGDMTSIASILAQPDDADISAKGLYVSAVTTRGFVATDGKDAIYVYANAKPSAAIGDKVDFTGKKTPYYEVYEITEPKVTVVSSGNTVPYPTAKDITSTFDTYKATTAEYITFIAEPFKSGNYTNFKVEGASRTGSLSSPDNSVYDALTIGQKFRLTGYYNTIVTKGNRMNLILVKYEKI